MLWRLAIVVVCSGAAFIPNAGAAIDTYDNYHDDNHDYHDNHDDGDHHDNHDDGDHHDYENHLDYEDHHEGLGGAVFEVLKAEIQQICKMNNAAYQIKAVEKAIDDFHDCLHDMAVFEEFDHELHDLEIHNLVQFLTSVLQSYMQSLCVVLRKSHKCLIRLAPSIKPCLPPEEYKLYVMEFNCTFNTIHYLCYNKGQRIPVFLNTHGIGCIAKKWEKIEACIVRSEQSAGITTHHDIAKLKIKELCDLEDQRANCYITPMRNCESPIPARLMEGMYKYSRQRSPCHTVKPLDTGYYWNFNAVVPVKIKKRVAANYRGSPASEDVMVNFNSNIKANFE